MYFILTFRCVSKFISYFISNPADRMEIKDIDSKKQNHKKKVSLDKTATNEIK